MAAIAGTAAKRATGGRLPAPGDQLEDLRFRSLLGREGWDLLPSAVQNRFRQEAVAGQVGDLRRHRGPLPHDGRGMAARPALSPDRGTAALGRDTGLAAVVTVTEDGAHGGQVWTRMYSRQRGFPQVIHSAKRFAGPTGLEEYLGLGFGIALTVAASAEGIRFTSDHYFIRLRDYRVRLPAFLAPGKLTIDHTDLGHGTFAFTLALRHRLLGDLIHQIGHFHDQPAGQPGDMQ